MEWKWEKERILVTGGSSGLGAELTKKAAELGSKCAIIGRDMARLRDVSDPLNNKPGCQSLITPYEYDLSDINNIPDLYKMIVDKWDGQHPTLLFNNAGYNAAGFVINTPIDLYEHNYKTNVLAPISLIQCATPSMIQHSHGGIVTIVSAAMYHSFPGMSSYCSSKFSLGAIHESLRIEIALDGIYTLYVNPGAFQSRYWDNMDIGTRLGQFSYDITRTDRHPILVSDSIFEAINLGHTSLDLSRLADKLGKYLQFFFPSIFERLLIKRNAMLLSNRPGK